MIQEEDVARVGRVCRARGLAGEVEIEFTDDVLDDSDVDYLVCDCDGILVPFFWEEYRFKNHTTAIVKFEFVDNEEQARRLVGSAVYFPKSALADDDDGLPTRWTQFVGYTVLDVRKGLVGTVEAVDERTENVLFMVKSPSGGDVIVPAHEDLIQSCDAKERVVVIELPEGLLDLN